METPIYRAAYRWTSEEVTTSQRRHMRAQSKLSTFVDTLFAASHVDSEIATALNGTMLLLGIASIVGMVLTVEDADETRFKALLVLFGICVEWGVRVARKARTLRKARRDFGKQPGADQLIEFEVSAQEIKRFQRGLFYKASSWKNFTKVAEAPDGFLLYEHESTFVWLPLRAFEMPDAPLRVREIIQASGVTYQKIAA